MRGVCALQCIQRVPGTHVHLICDILKVREALGANVVGPPHPARGVSLCVALEQEAISIILHPARWMILGFWFLTKAIFVRT